MRRITPLVLAAILLTGGLASGFRLGKPVQTAASRPTASLQALPRTEHRQPAPWSPDRIRSPERLAATLVVRPAGPVALSEDAAALLAEICELQLLAQGTELELSSRQWSALAGVTLNIQAIRQAYEAQIATGAVLAPGRYRVEIPSYASAGDAIRARFHAGLRAELGETEAAGIIAKLGSRLEGHFAGFGVGVQTLDITAGPGGVIADGEVTRTMKYWNSVEGGGELTTRSETHFPGLEDPSGERWSDLLAVVGAGRTGGAGI